jgi:hypothetical protein
VRRTTTTWVLTVVAMLAVGPALALATGPSAGDNQYTDPLKSTASHPPPPPATTAPPPVAAPPATSSSDTATTTTPSTIAPGPAASAISSDTSPAATAPSLPRTGYDAWLAIPLGAGLISLGAGIRLRYIHR